MAKPGEMPGPFDRYSFAHLALGMVFEASRIPAGLAIGSHVAFECVEDRAKEVVRPFFPDTRPESLENHIGDVVAFTAGYYGARALRGTERADLALACTVGFGAAVWMWALLRTADLRERPRPEG